MDSRCPSTSSTLTDLTHIIEVAAQEQFVDAIPSPHVTVFYGMDHFESENHVLECFNQDLRPFFERRQTSVHGKDGGWPAKLKPIGMVCTDELIQCDLFLSGYFS